MHTALQSGRLTLAMLPAFADNYIWLLADGRHAVAVDPGDSAPVLAALEAQGLALSAILLTHHHADHVGGVQELLRHARVPVYGPDNPSISGITHAVRDGGAVRIAELDLDLDVLAVPGHTLDHIAYVGRFAGRTLLFCGDTLFAGGCGRLFEGTPAQMAASLERLAALPGDTLVCCAHEYTLANLRFALAAEPGNVALAARIAEDEAKRARGLPTLPSTIALERATNPFLRAGEPAIAAGLAANARLTPGQSADALACFTALRAWKNVF